jgi:very-short-patch-repair endonuclease/predicted transcriptional regulator of viral defense system
MDGKVATRDKRIAAVAAQQHGVLSIRQLRAAGVSDDAVRGRVRSGRLHRVHRGVYAIGHAALADEGRWMAAVLACDCSAFSRVRDAGHWADQPAAEPVESRSAALSHRSAAELWGLLSPAHGPVDVTVVGNGGRGRRAGLRIHRSRSLESAETTTKFGIPVTTPARTVADLRTASRGNRRGGVSANALRHAVRQAEYRGLRVDSDPETDGTRSELEAMFLRLCRRHGLPAPEVNVEVGPLTVDFLWRDRSLVIETDGYRAHRGHQAFEDDRDRDLRLRSLGHEVVRLSYKQVSEEPARVAATLRALLCGD